MATKKITGTGIIAATDYKTVKWVGKTKGGQAVEITLSNAINLGNTELTFADKDDVVEEVTFTATYLQTDLDAGTITEPWEITYTDGFTTSDNEIMLGAGKLYIGTTPLALTRGGGKFTREVETREIAADGDRGPVKGRIVIDSVRATLSMSSLQILTTMAPMHAGLSEATESGE